MNSPHRAGPAKIAVRSDNFHRWRSRKDKLASKVIALGGFVVIAAVLLILFYLLYVVAPLFMPAKISSTDVAGSAEWLEGNTSFLSLEEQQQVALRINQNGFAEFFSLDGLQLIDSIELGGNGQRVA
ncbi:MAG: hypothetical protein WBN06_10995, partial [Lysobacterales bacterium]